MYLSNKKVGHFSNELTSDVPKDTIIRDITCEEIIEKHAILDVMFHGKEIFDNFEEKKFITTYEMIKMYADP